MNNIVCETKRCIIRELSMDDMEALFKLYSYPGMTDHMEGLLPWDEECEYQQAYIKYMYGFYGYGLWLCFDRVSNELIARAGLENRILDDGTNDIELGYAVGTPFWNQGYATEICKAILDVSPDYIYDEPIYAFIKPANEASIGFITNKLSFKYDCDIVVEKQKYKRFKYEKK